VSEQEAEQQLEDEIAAQMAPDADAGSDDEADVPEDDPPNVPVEDPEPSSLALIEKRGKDLDGLAKTVKTRLTSILGADLELFEECEICNYWNTPGWRITGPLPAEVADVVRLALGMHGEAEYQRDEYSRACEKCNGLGVVLTGSKAVGQETLQCLPCKGFGWVPIGDERRIGAFATVNGPAAAPPAPLAGPLPAAPESPEIAAARALLQGAGHMVIAPIPVT
jgi:hypothetical protein